MPFGALRITTSVIILVGHEPLKCPVIAESNAAIGTDMGVARTVEDVRAERLIASAVPKWPVTGMASLAISAGLPPQPVLGICVARELSAAITAESTVARPGLLRRTDRPLPSITDAKRPPQPKVVKDKNVVMDRTARMKLRRPGACAVLEAA